MQEAVQRTLRTVPQFCKENPAFNENGMRWLLFHRKQNGLHKAVVQLGRRVLIDVDRFYNWLDEQQQNGNGGGGSDD